MEQLRDHRIVMQKASHTPSSDRAMWSRDAEDVSALMVETLVIVGSH